MQEKLLEFIKEIQSDERFDSYDEPAIKQGIVLRILSFLDWDPFNMKEIKPEYDVKDGKVDFSLRHKNSNKVFVEVKKGAKALKKYQEQIMTHAAEEGVKIAVLTDGITWWFSLPLLGGSLEEKRFHTIDINEQRAEDITQYFFDFLYKKNIISGKAVKAAEQIYNTRQKTLLIQENLPKAWEKIMSEPGKWLYDILAEATKSLCGHKPDRKTVEKFIAIQTDAKADITRSLKSSAPKRTKEKRAAAGKGDYEGKFILSFTFKGIRYEVKSWEAMLVKICEIISVNHADDFEMVLTLSGPNREYFSRNPYALLTCEKISGTEIYVDVNLSTTDVVTLSHRILSLFGYRKSDLSIKTK